MMKALVVESKNRLAVWNVDLPAIGKYEALCKIKYCATCTGTDTHIINGTFPYPITYPTVLGHESVGEVIELGENVRHLKIGDHITKIGTKPTLDMGSSWGGFAEYGIARDFRSMQEDGLPSYEWNWPRYHLVIDKDIDLRQAPMIITWRETLSFLQSMGNLNGKSILIIGSGGVGLSFANIAKLLGAKRIVIVGNQSRNQAAINFVTHEVIDYRSESVESKLSQALPNGCDFLVDSIANPISANHALPLLTPNGVFAVYGLGSFSDYTINPRISRGTFQVYNGGYIEEDTNQAIIQFVKNGQLESAVWYDANAPVLLKDASGIFEKLKNREHIKILVDCR